MEYSEIASMPGLQGISMAVARLLHACCLFGPYFAFLPYLPKTNNPMIFS